MNEQETQTERIRQYEALVVKLTADRDKIDAEIVKLQERIAVCKDDLIDLMIK